jgi:hypothetical protein
LSPLVTETRSPARLRRSIPVVGYDSGASLAAARRAGFDGIGELVVWLRAD